MSSHVFDAGDVVRLTDPKGRHHTIILESGGAFHTHRGRVEHDSLIGADEGSVVHSDQGVAYLAFRPLLEDFVLSMPRGAAIIYPKDATQILQRADIAPGQRVLEAGLGSGALSLWLLRSLGETGELISVERREEFADIARDNVQTYFRGKPPGSWRVEIGDAAEVMSQMPEGSIDRIILDMLTPWECLEQALRLLRPGGIILGYVATVTQLSRFVEATRSSGLTTEPESTETLVRTWHVEGLAVRPDHRMIGHTAFLSWARKLNPGHELPRPIGKKAKPEYSEEDIEAWTPGALGRRVETDKKLRQLKRESAKRAAKTRSERSEPDEQDG